jgi:hypothetical protein
MKRILLTGRNSSFPKFLPPRAPFPARGQLARSAPSLVERASPVYDATRDVWIIPPSRAMRDAGGAAELRQPRTKHNTAARRARRSPLARHLLEIAEFFVVTIGLGASVILAFLLWAVMA